MKKKSKLSREINIIKKKIKNKITMQNEAERVAKFIQKNMVLNKKITILQVLPDLNSGGVERGTLEVNKYLASKGYRTLVVSNGGIMVEELKGDKGEHYKLGVGKKNLLVIFTIFKLINFIKINKIDIVHARSRLPAWVCFFAIKLINNKS